MNKSKEEEYPYYNQRTLKKVDGIHIKLVELGMPIEDTRNIILSVARQPKGLFNLQKGVEFGVELLNSKKITNPVEILNVLKKAGDSIGNEINEALENEPHDPNFGSGSVRELEVAALRIRQNSTEIQIGTIKVGSGGVYKSVGADVVDRTPRIKEAIQVKRVSSSTKKRFWDNFEKAIEQLNGNKREEIPRGYASVADIQVSNCKNPVYNQSAASFIEIIRTRPSLKALLKDFNGTVFITSRKDVITLKLERGVVVTHSNSKVQSNPLSANDQELMTFDFQAIQSPDLLDSLLFVRAKLSGASDRSQAQRSDRIITEPVEDRIDDESKEQNNLEQSTKQLTPWEEVELIAAEVVQINLHPPSPIEDLDEDYGLSM